jgi:hypothetical protein
MAKYSNRSDIQDELIKQLSKRSDHMEAEEYVDKVLTKIGVDSANTAVTPLLKKLAVAYATYKRAFYESKTKDDIFYQKYLGYEKELRTLTTELIRKGDSYAKDN